MGFGEDLARELDTYCAQQANSRIQHAYDIHNSYQPQALLTTRVINHKSYQHAAA